MTNSKTPRKRRAYPPKYRAARAELIRKTRPWEKTTGPKTPEGKAAVSDNALKHGFRSRDMKEIRRLLRLQRDLVKDLLAGAACPSLRGAHATKKSQDCRAPAGRSRVTPGYQLTPPPKPLRSSHGPAKTDNRDF